MDVHNLLAKYGKPSTLLFSIGEESLSVSPDRHRRASGEVLSGVASPFPPMSVVIQPNGDAVTSFGPLVQDGLHRRPSRLVQMAENPALAG